MGLILSSTLDLYRLVCVPLVSVIDKHNSNATASERVAMIKELVTSKLAFSFNTPAYATV